MRQLITASVSLPHNGGAPGAPATSGAGRRGPRKRGAAARGRRAVIASTIAGAGWLIVLIVTGASAALARSVWLAAAALPSPLGRIAAMVAFVALVVAGYEAVTLPFTYFRFHLERKYGLSSEPLR